jgi:hypothetical protein
MVVLLCVLGLPPVPGMACLTQVVGLVCLARLTRLTCLTCLLELFWLFRTVQNCSELFGVVWCYFIETRDPKALQLRTSAYGALETLSESQVP